MEIKAQAAMLLTLVAVDGAENVRASVLEGTNEDLNDTARDMAGVLVSMANNPKPPFDPDPQLAEKDARIASLAAEVERLTLGYHDCLEDLICCGYQLDDYFQAKYGLDEAVAKHTEALKGNPNAR